MNIEDLNLKLVLNKNKINKWINNYTNNVPIYSSVDFRQSKFKLVPIDTNIFPTGFNILNKKSINTTSIYFKNFINKKNKKIAIFVENFTRNTKYWDNIKKITNILLKLNLDIKIIANSNKTTVNKMIQLLGIQIYNIIDIDGYISIGNNWIADFIILNNDLTYGVPKFLIKTKTPILPSTEFSWSFRSKYKHNLSFNNIINDFTTQFKFFDPWLVTSYCNYLYGVNFMTRDGLKQITCKVKKLLTKIKSKYKKYAINYKPYVFIKSDKGTLGRGILNTNNADTIVNINKNKRKNMNYIKCNINNDRILLQEGINSNLSHSNYSAENTINLINNGIIGKSVRYNTTKNNISNLNSFGMQFTTCNQITYIQSILSKLATIATYYEKQY